MAGRRAGLLVCLALLGLGVGLASLPLDLPAIRLAGVGFVWWYGLVVVPVAVVLAVSILALGRLVEPAAAAAGGGALLMSPAVVVAVVAHVFTGGQGGPLLAAALVLAALVAFLGPPVAVAPGRLATAARVTSAGLVLWANALVAGEIARLAGGRRWHGL
ncbi:MAG: hypothetical protein HY728_09305, partial [Candidatus Rokubacteria bacterium]|nr:hypothetical protein [Candidatus Rokubacteria bacterium]